MLRIVSLKSFSWSWISLLNNFSQLNVLNVLMIHPITKFGWFVKNKSTQEDEFWRMWVGSKTTWCDTYPCYILIVYREEFLTLKPPVIRRKLSFRLCMFDYAWVVLERVRNHKTRLGDLQSNNTNLFFKKRSF